MPIYINQNRRTTDVDALASSAPPRYATGLGGVVRP